MLAPNFIAEESSSSKAKCRACGQFILMHDLRIRVPPALLYHLRCFVPEYPVRINPKQVPRILYQEESNLVLDEWLEKWNQQFKTVPVRDLRQFFRPAGQVAMGNERTLLEPFKYLSASDVISAGLVCHRWYTSATHPEIWNDLNDLFYPKYSSRHHTFAHPKFLYIYLEKATCAGCKEILNDAQVAYLSPNNNRPVCVGCSHTMQYSITNLNEYIITTGVSKKYAEEAKVPLYNFGGRKIIFSSIANDTLTRFRERRRQDLFELLRQHPHYFRSEDVKLILKMDLNLNSYVGPFLLLGKGEQEDLLDMLAFVFKSCSKTGLTGKQLLQRNEKRYKRRREWADEEGRVDNFES